MPSQQPTWVRYLCKEQWGSGHLLFVQRQGMGRGVIHTQGISWCAFPLKTLFRELCKCSSALVELIIWSVGPYPLISFLLLVGTPCLCCSRFSLSQKMVCLIWSSPILFRLTHILQAVQSLNVLVVLVVLIQSSLSFWEHHFLSVVLRRQTERWNKGRDQLSCQSWNWRLIWLYALPPASADLWWFIHLAKECIF